MLSARRGHEVCRRLADLFEIAWFLWGMGGKKRPLSLSYELKFAWGKFGIPIVASVLDPNVLPPVSSR